MRWHKTFLVSIMCVAGMAASFLAFGASTSYATKVVTVGVNGLLGEKTEATKAPVLVMQLQDGLAAGDIFYCNLKGASWTEEKIPITYTLPGSTTVEELLLEAKQVSKTQLEVKLSGADLPKGSVLELPLYTQLNAAEATISIDSNNTAITEETILFAKATDKKAEVVVSQVPVGATTDEIGTIAVEEVYGKQFYNALCNNVDGTITLSLQNTDLRFRVTNDTQLVGSKGFGGMSSDHTVFTQTTPQVLKINLTDFINQKVTANKEIGRAHV